ncbi:hypothetical protein OGAPHI_004516 [Ogataea philodendri]|uniref:Uncharacterized protein n=1 Tax=Ogataea philodendri TaxID=1378263 RepID=A0A9P8P7N0_9ASCO|nr:uncharacterized protein OGAPHI_004516 [Ogataea philodendri]KAH3666327.1 hypothetical protein OGAPHI_004516 [Ogataea philodendri]
MATAPILQGSNLDSGDENTLVDVDVGCSTNENTQTHAQERETGDSKRHVVLSSKNHWERFKEPKQHCKNEGSVDGEDKHNWLNKKHFDRLKQSDEHNQHQELAKWDSFLHLETSLLNSLSHDDGFVSLGTDVNRNECSSSKEQLNPHSPSEASNSIESAGNLVLGDKSTDNWSNNWTS